MRSRAPGAQPLFGKHQRRVATEPVSRGYITFYRTHKQGRRGQLAQVHSVLIIFIQLSSILPSKTVCCWRVLTKSGKMLKSLGKMFTTGLDNPKFTPQDSKGQDYEVRTYQQTMWVSTTVTGMDQEAALNTGFNRLFKYIQGNNEKNVKVEMTAPVTCLINPGEGPACENSFSVSFYVPEEHQADPPKPSAPEIFIENRKEFTVFVRTYGGFANTQNTSEELLKLTESLKRDGMAFKEAPYYRVGYDSPFKLVNRRNEVWLIKQEEGK